MSKKKRKELCQQIDELASEMRAVVRERDALKKVLAKAKQDVFDFEEENELLKEEVKALKAHFASMSLPSGFVELPEDADGMPIMVGDHVSMFIGDELVHDEVVATITRWPNGWTVETNVSTYAPRMLRHVHACCCENRF